MIICVVYFWTEKKQIQDSEWNIFGYVEIWLYYVYLLQGFWFYLFLLGYKWVEGKGNV